MWILQKSKLEVDHSKERYTNHLIIPCPRAGSQPVARQVRACSIGGLLAHTCFFPKWMPILATLANNDNMCGARTH